MRRPDPSQGCAWVTGASSGIGRALSLRLAREGWRVAASARRAGELNDLAAEAQGLAGSITPYPLDVTDHQAVLDTVAAIERDLAPVELAVLDAGTHRPMRARDFKASEVSDLVSVNLFGVASGLEALIPAMTGRRRGRIALVASLAGYAGLPTAAAYSASKAGVIALAEALKPELDAMGVDVQVVCPGFVKTPLTDRNDFDMPFLMELDDAVEAFHSGLMGKSFEIVFPRRFAWLMKLLRMLPYPLFFAATRKIVPDD